RKLTYYNESEKTANENLFFSAETSMKKNGNPVFLYVKGNHLGNVMAVISDRKIPVDVYDYAAGTNNWYDFDTKTGQYVYVGAGGDEERSTAADGYIDYFIADVDVYSDYYPGHQQLPGRSGGSTTYRFAGANGQEKETEVTSTNSHYSAEYWMYDSRTVRRWEQDPINYAWQSPYATFNNNPIIYSDRLGLAGEDEIRKVSLKERTQSAITKAARSEAYFKLQVTAAEIRQAKAEVVVSKVKQQMTWVPKTQPTPEPTPQVAYIGPQTYDDYTGTIQNATPEHREAAPFSAWVKDMSADLLNAFYPEVTAIDDLAAVSTDPNSTWKDVTLATFNFILATPGKRPIRNQHLAGGVHPVTKVRFDADGYPDFSKHLYQGGKNDVIIKPTGTRDADFAAANKAAGYDATPKGYTWHHHQETGRMQLVDSEIHSQTGHTGGYSMWGQETK
ncbi:MAG: HNH endonuclease, partial [Bacteroidota bacterium]